eukprot:6634248-Pyramimonas_sp.AAC.1
MSAATWKQSPHETAPRGPPGCQGVYQGPVRAQVVRTCEAECLSRPNTRISFQSPMATAL